MINLQKGGRINLSKETPEATKFTLGLGWDTRATDGAEFDLDASVLLLDAQGQPAKGGASLIFYNNLKSECGGVESSGDNRSGEGEGDDEQITFDLSKIDSTIEKAILIVTIHDAQARGQNFGLVNNAFVRVLKDDDTDPIARYDLSEDYSTETAVIFGEFYRKDGDWRFGAKGDGFAGGLEDFLKSYGLA